MRAGPEIRSGTQSGTQSGTRRRSRTGARTGSSAPGRVYAGTLRWVMKHRQRFHPADPWLGDLRWRLKAYAELVFLVILLLRRQGGAGNRDIANLTHYIRSVWDDWDLEATVRRDPAGTVALAMFEEFTRLTGGSSGPFRQPLRRILQAGYVQTMERLPFRVLDLRYTLDRARIPHNLPDLRTLFECTIAARSPWIPYLTTLDVYSITHTIFYVTDMGHRPAARVVGDGAAELCRLVRWLLGMAVRQGDLDLTGELLICSAALGLPASPVTRAAWHSLASRQMADGSVPGPTFVPARWAALTGEARQRYHFQHCYHTTLVALGASLYWQRPAGDHTRGPCEREAT